MKITTAPYWNNANKAQAIPRKIQLYIIRLLLVTCAHVGRAILSYVILLSLPIALTVAVTHHLHQLNSPIWTGFAAGLSWSDRLELNYTWHESSRYLLLHIIRRNFQAKKLAQSYWSRVEYRDDRYTALVVIGLQQCSPTLHATNKPQLKAHDRRSRATWFEATAYGKAIKTKRFSPSCKPVIGNIALKLITVNLLLKQ